MALNIKCNVCAKELDEAGAVILEIISPPDSVQICWAKKIHICSGECWALLKTFLGIK